MAPTKIFLLGATGYIGGSVLTTLLQYPDKFQIKALVRSSGAQADVLRSLGVEPVVGSLQDSDILEKASFEADAVINTADADHLASVQAILKGLKAKNDPNAVYLHTTGTGMLLFADGPIEKPFDDSDIARIHSIPLSALHRDVDTYIYAEAEGFLRYALLAPSTINGIGTGPFKRTSQQMPNLARAAIARKQAGWVGPRTDTTWNNVNINDLADLYLLVLNGLLAGNIDSGKAGGFYFATAAEHTWKDLSIGIGKVLYKHGLVSTPEASEFDQATAHKYLGGDLASNFWGSDSRATSSRSLKLGWKPHRPDVYATLEQELIYLIKTGGLNSQ